MSQPLARATAAMVSMAMVHRIRKLLCFIVVSFQFFEILEAQQGYYLLQAEDNTYRDALIEDIVLAR